MKLGDVVWRPPPEAWTSSPIGHYLAFLRTTRGLSFASYEELHQWSVAQLSEFWASLWEFYGVRSHSAFVPGLAESRMPGATWFPGASLNYAEHALRGEQGGAEAVIEHSQVRGRSSLTWDELRSAVARVRAALVAADVGRGDRVATYCPTITEALLVYLACASLGAIYSSCPVEFGVQGVVSRLGQIKPKVIVGVDGYRYGARTVTRHEELAEMARSLPGLEHLVVIPYLESEPGLPPAAMSWSDFLDQPPAPMEFTPVPFDHPLAIVYSSGTTGSPKPIVHGHGGVLVEHLKSLGLQLGLSGSDRFFWYTTTGWMMWNYLVSGLLVGSAVVLYDGDPAYPDHLALWRMAASERVTVFGVSPRFLLMNRRAGIRPGSEVDLSALTAVGSTGSPLELDAYRWFGEAVSPGIPLVSSSGGTDVLSALVCGAPIVPVYAGEISCAALGVDVDVIDSAGQPVTDEAGDLVVRQPMPSMPVGFWGDPDGTRLHGAYFAANPGLWTHGDWATVTPRKTFRLSGRSDATLNRGGVRIGTAELYSVVDRTAGISDSVAVCLEGADGQDDLLLLFVVPQDGGALDGELESRLKREIRQQLSPRHVPDRILAIDSVPRTNSGKKAEIPLKRMLQGRFSAGSPSESVTMSPAVAEYLSAVGRELSQDDPKEPLPC